MNSGAFNIGGRFIKCGFTGCPDIIGQLKDGRFLAIEVKKSGGKLTKEQNEFITMVNMNHRFGIVATDPFWNTGSPANGYGCSCSSNLLNERDVKRLGLKVEDPPKGFKPDEGFDYRPGGDDVRKMYDNMKEKADNYTPELKENFNKYLGEGNGN